MWSGRKPVQPCRRGSISNLDHVGCYKNANITSTCHCDHLPGGLSIADTAQNASPLSTTTMQDKYRQADEALLASLGYKQEFKREFTPFEVFGISFSIIGLLPSIASVLVYALPNGGPVAMVWGWAVANVGILLIAMSMAELASAAPTSGGVTSFLLPGGQFF